MTTQAQINNLVSALNQALALAQALTPDVTPAPVPAPVPVPQPAPAPAPTTGSLLLPKPVRLATESLDQFKARCASYIATLVHVGQGLHTAGAKAALIKAHSNLIDINNNPIMSLYDFNGVMAGNAPPHWDDKTMTAYNIDGSILETYTGK